MVCTIPEEVVESATRCQKNCSCLESEKPDVCKVISFAGDEVIFVEADDKHACSYRVSFGSAYFCACPVRKELYKRFGI